MFLEVKGLSFLNGKDLILSEINFALEKNSIGCLLGASGSGKTTLLRCIAGLERPVRGSVVQNGIEVNSSYKSLSPAHRDIGMVSQDLALFPHFTVEENIGFAVKKNAYNRKNTIINDLLELTSLGHRKNKYPYELSGGEQQRVALARTLASEPQLLLLDEPFSNLDTVMRERLVKEVRGILKEKKISSLLVTHDQNEAFAFSEYCGVIHEGKLLQWDTCYQLYHQPITREVAYFLGEGSFISAKPEGKTKIKTALGIHQVPDLSLKKGEVFDIFIRPDDLVYDPKGKYKLKVKNKEFRGPFIHYTLVLNNNSELYCYTLSHHDIDIGKPLSFNIEIQHLIIMNK